MQTTKPHEDLFALILDICTMRPGASQLVDASATIRVLAVDIIRDERAVFASPIGGLVREEH